MFIFRSGVLLVGFCSQAIVESQMLSCHRLLAQSIFLGLLGERTFECLVFSEDCCILSQDCVFFEVARLKELLNFPAVLCPELAKLGSKLSVDLAD